jgi:hypothetical protein
VQVGEAIKRVHSRHDRDEACGIGWGWLLQTAIWIDDLKGR